MVDHVNAFLSLKLSSCSDLPAAGPGLGLGSSVICVCHLVSFFKHITMLVLEKCGSRKIVGFLCLG